MSSTIEPASSLIHWLFSRKPAPEELQAQAESAHAGACHIGGQAKTVAPFKSDVKGRAERRSTHSPMRGNSVEAKVGSSETRLATGTSGKFRAY